MGEENNTNTSNATNQNEQNTINNNDVNEPTLEELKALLEKEKAEREKQKQALDKALKEKGEITKQLRQKMTAEETEAEEKRIADEQKQAEYEKAISELNHLKATSAYSSIEDEKVVENLISAISDADHKTIAMIIENEKKQAVKAAEAQWLKTRGRVNSGNKYSAMTKDEIMAISDRNERRIAIALNRELFEKN